MLDPEHGEHRQGRQRPCRAGVALPLVASLGACGGTPQWQHTPHDRMYQHERPEQLHPIVAALEPSDWVEGFYNNTFVQIGRLVSPGYYVERRLGGPAALDVNAFGKVPDSTWFENRIGRTSMTAERVFIGPDTSAGPASGALSITKAKFDGVTPGFFVKDEAGVRWLVKFDVPAFPEMSSAAEVISTKLLYAVGYHVPENHVGRFWRSDLVLSPKATMNDRYNREVPFTRERLEILLDSVEAEPDGRLRAMFSRFVSGRPVGPFPLQGVRSDDPNDRIPHERRRSLRGLWVFYAWLNNTDAKVNNGLDAFVEVDGQRRLGYLQHYLIDFGSSLGSLGRGPKLSSDGYEYNVDWERIGIRYLTLGAQSPYWQAVRRTPFRGVGVFESQVFDPSHWRPQYPNIDFDSADVEDTFWAAAILAHVPNDAIDAAVRAGELTEAGAAGAVSLVLRQRRDKLLRHAFAHLAPLDDPEIVGASRLAWIDLERLAGLPEAADRYEWRVDWRAGDERFERYGAVGSPSLELGAVSSELLARYPTELARSPFIDVRLRGVSRRGASPWLTVHLRACESGELIAVGVDRR